MARVWKGSIPRWLGRIEVIADKVHNGSKTWEIISNMGEGYCKECKQVNQIESNANPTYYWKYMFVLTWQKPIFQETVILWRTSTTLYITWKQNLFLSKIRYLPEKSILPLTINHWASWRNYWVKFWDRERRSDQGMTSPFSI